MSTGARSAPVCKLSSSIARDIASPAVKMGNRSLFPGVAVPLAFFCILFFRHRKKSMNAPWDGKSHSRAVVGASGPAGRRPAPAGAPKGFPRGKQSARFALPCAPLVVCLNSGSLTAFGGCIHWIPASLRSPLETFGHQSWQETEGTVTIALADKYSLFEKNKGGLSSKRPSLP